MPRRAQRRGMASFHCAQLPPPRGFAVRPVLVPLLLPVLAGFDEEGVLVAFTPVDPVVRVTGGVAGFDRGRAVPSDAPLRV